MCLDDSQSLRRIKIPQLNNAVKFTGGHDLLDATTKLLIILNLMPQTPKLDGAIACTGDQDVVVSANVHCRTLGHDHAVHIAIVRKVPNAARVHFENIMCFGNQSPSVIITSRCTCAAADSFGVEEAMVASVRVLL
ncbi:hypothetical protein HG530_013226 [Fusarium avenaceum]|nr:hypothetical protein HG530_013226 [Fusarium avenaceum]